MIGETHMNLHIRDVLVITMYSGGWENESTRIRGRKATRNKHSSCCHLLSSSRSFNLWKGSSSQDHKGVIQIEETNPDIGSITRRLGIEPMNVIGSEGY